MTVKYIFTTVSNEIRGIMAKLCMPIIHCPFTSFAIRLVIRCKLGPNVVAREGSHTTQSLELPQSQILPAYPLS